MTTLEPRDRTPGTPAPTSRSRLRAVALPTEHGGWSLTGEPVLLGLLVAWSWSGLALGVAAMLAFVARTPLKVVLVDRWRHRWLDRTRLASMVAVVELTIIVALAVAAARSADGRFWVPLALAAPLVAVELWYDMRSRSRRLLPELAGVVGISSVAAAIVLADGGSATRAAGLWCVLAARGAAAIPYVRVQILRALGRPFQRSHSDGAQVLAVAAIAVAWMVDFIPIAPVVAMAVIAVVNVAAVRRPPRAAKVIGLQQLAFGLALVVVTAIAMT